MKKFYLYQKCSRLMTKQFVPINLRKFVIAVSLVLVVVLAGCQNGSGDAENISPTSISEDINDNSGADENISPTTSNEDANANSGVEENNGWADQDNPPGSVTWATDQTNVLIRWYGREAAGLPVYAPESNNSLPTILPGSPLAPTLKVERKTIPSNTYEELASGITRLTDQSEAQDLIDSGDWWQEISTYVTNSQQIAVDQVNIAVTLGGILSKNDVEWIKSLYKITK